MAPRLCVTGVPLSYQSLRHGGFCFAFDHQVPLGLLFLLAAQLLILLGVPAMRFRLSRRLGLALIAFYALFMLSAVLLQALDRGEGTSVLDRAIHLWFGTSRLCRR